MGKGYTKKTGKLLLLSGLFLSVLFGAIAPVAVSAADPAVSATYINYDTIEISHGYTGNGMESQKGRFLLSNKTGENLSTLVYTPDRKNSGYFDTSSDQSTSCTPYLVISDLNNDGLPKTDSARLVLKRNDGRGSTTCERVSRQLDLKNRSNGSRTLFNWSDSSTLVPVGPLPFNKEQNGTDRPQLRNFPAFTKQADGTFSNASENPGCASYIDRVNGGSGKVHLWNQSPGDCQSKYKSNYDINIGLVTENSRKPAGSGTEQVATDNPNSGEDQDNSCESKAGNTGWITCTLLYVTDMALGFVDEQIQSFITIDKDKYDNPEIKEAWRNIRNIAYLLLIPITLVMVIGTILGFEFVSAYTVKKALPRLIIATIFITFSYSICVFLIELFNVLGNGVLGLLTAPFGDRLPLSLASLYDGEGFSGLITGVPGAAAGLVGLIVFLWLFGGTLLLIAGTAFLILLAREIAILLLLMLAPLAILAWIFPENVRLWKVWSGAFIRLLMMFPIIMAVIASGRIMAFLIDAEPNPSTVTGVVNAVAKIAVYILPYAFIPFTFKLAGGLFATLTGMVNDKEKGLFDRQRKKRADKLERTAEGNLFRGAPESSLRGSMNRFGAGALNLNKAGVNPMKMRSRMRTALSTGEFDHAMEAMEKDSAVRAVIDNDDLLSAGLSGRGAESDVRKYLQGKGYAGRDLDQNVAAVMAAKRSVGDQGFRIAAAVGNAGTGTGYGGGSGEMLAAINEVAGGDRALAGRMLAVARSKATQARRPDLGGAGFGDTLTAMNNLHRGVDANGNTVTEQSVTADLDRKALRAQGGNYIVGARRGAVERLAPMMVADLEAAYQSGDQGKIDRALATIAGRYDAMAQVAPENAEVMAQNVLSAGMNVPRMIVERQEDGTITRRTVQGATVRQLIEDARSRPPDENGNQAFLEMRREYASAGIAAANQQNARMGGEPVDQPPTIPS